MNSDSTFLAKLTPYMQQELRKLGVEMEVRKVDWALFTQLVEEHRFDATSLRWGNSDVVQDPYEIWHSSQAKDGSNYVFFSDPAVDALIEQARATLDDGRRNELYRRMGRLLYDDAPYVFLYSRLRRSLGVACLFISHDLRLAACLCSRIAVLAEGSIAEILEPAALRQQTVP
jgi:peptide/nickel transport system substrate-binding protein